jgi:hypothetical protein
MWESFKESMGEALVYLGIFVSLYLVFYIISILVPFGLECLVNLVAYLNPWFVIPLYKM